MSDVQRKLTTILAADVVSFSKMMGNDEAATLAALKSCRAIIDGLIEEHHGRIFGSAGDSVIADFSSPVNAVICANEFQKNLADRNENVEDGKRMTFRVGVNMGDVIIDGDNLFGDGVNVAARLEAIARPGGICVSSKIHEEVRRKLDLLFVNGGSQQLKNIDEEINVYHLGGKGDAAQAAPEKTTTGASAMPSGGKPRLAVEEIKVVGGDDETAFLAEGLRDVILGGLARQAALTVVQDAAEADFQLEGGIRAAGARLRLTFNLSDRNKGAQVWSERYDRTTEDVFDLEDEISQSIVSELRIRLKVLEFEKLENTDNADLSVPDLLSKVAGYFVRSFGDNEMAEEALKVAIERAPENSMAWAMLALCGLRQQEFSPLAFSPEAEQQLLQQSRQALSLDQSSYFAHLVAAILAHDLLGNFRDAQMHAEMALAANPNFTQAQAMIGIVNCHIGDRTKGMAQIRRAIEANKEDPHRVRHLRELTLALFLEGAYEEAADTVRRLKQHEPEMCRNGLISASVFWHAGAEAQARGCIEELLERYPSLNLGNLRTTQFADPDAAHQFLDGLISAGLPRE